VARPQRYFDPSQPQMLQIATFLLYLDAALLVLRGVAFSPIGLVWTVASAGAAYGMANNKKWGYMVAVGVAAFALILPFLFGSTLTDQIRFSTVEFLLAVALVGLLVHPQSREYQRIWYS